eukprot:gene10931-12754_t
MLNHCVSLTRLHLLGCFDLEEVFTHITATLELTDLDCSEDPLQFISLSGAAVRAMAQVAPHLTSLDLSFTNNSVEDSDIDMLVQHCRSLDQIKFLNFASITSAAVVSVAQYLSRLFFVDLDGCFGVSDTGIIALAQAATSLGMLTLTGVNITDTSVLAIGTHCRELSTLNVEYCIISVAAVTDAVALSFRAHCPNLMKPSLPFCSVSAEVLEQLKQSR